MANINILVALSCEAKPLIKHFKLQRLQQYESFSVFSKDNIRLLVSGIGQINTAMACGWLAAKELNHSKFSDIWLNIGTAGHGSLDVGECFVVNQVGTDTGKAYYPPLVVDWKGHYSALQTVDQPSHQYHEGLAFDMEAYAFFLATQKFTSAELVQSFKVVSDNPENSIDQLNAKILTQLIEGRLADIEQYMDQLQQLANTFTEMPEHEIGNQALQMFHFTQTQKHQLADQLRRWEVLRANAGLSELNISSCRNAKQVLQLLSEKLVVEPIAKA